MKTEAANIIAEYVGEIREDYSGKGMYGKTTTGIIVDSHDEFFRALGEIMRFTDEEDREEVGQALRNIRTDNMGTEMIFY